MVTARRHFATVIAVVIAVTAGRGSLAQIRACPDITVPDVPVAPGKRALVPEDLLKLRDIGVSDAAFPDAHTLSVSPDGTRVAFQLRQANAATNAYCTAMLVLDVRPGAKPRIVDRGGDPIWLVFDFRGKAAFPTGEVKPITPWWSPDGKWIAFLKRVEGITQIWRANADGGGSAPITHSTTGIEDFEISPSGHAIIFSTRPGLDVARRAIENEALSGYHFDDRYSPMSSNKPFPKAPIPNRVWHMDIGSGIPRAASAVEIAELGDATTMPVGAATRSNGKGNEMAWITASTEFPPSSRVTIGKSAETPRLCPAPECSGRVYRPSWSQDGTRLRFFRREGWGNGTTTIYEVSRTPRRARRLYSTDDVLASCEGWHDGLICLREAADQPRRIVLMDLHRHSSIVLFDPNPEIAHLKLGHTDRLHWTNSFGVETYGDLVLPTDYRPGARYPLVVVQYESRGFLRGGTGDEYPIQAFANDGYAVLSFNRPRNYGLQPGAKSWIDNERLNVTQFIDRRSVESSLEMGIDMLVRRRIVDPTKIGITGLSDGASTVDFALIHSKIFAAAAVSNGGWGPAMSIFVGPQAMRDFTAEGYPDLNKDDPGFWKQISLAANAARIKVPILMQLPDDEYLSAVGEYTALALAGDNVEMFVYPGEHHIKYQPMHRLAIYRRNVAWFDYWLKGQCGKAPTDLVGWADPARC